VRHSVTLVGIGIGLALIVVGLTLAARLGMVTINITRPDGHAFWLFSRAAGITAYVALTAVTVWGLLLSTAIADTLVSRGRSLDAHRWLSAAALALSVAHAFALVGDRYITFDILDTIVPFLAPYRPAAVGAGIVALYLSLAVYGSFWLRAYIGQRGWRAVHFLSFPAFGLITLHGLFAGTDSGSPWVLGTYITATMLVGMLTLVRMLSRAGPAVRRNPTRAEA
jgi:sulfoxide reductase heme-binding subunit YedZ